MCPSHTLSLIGCFHSHTSTHGKNTVCALEYQMSRQKLGVYLFNRCSLSLPNDKVPRTVLGDGDGIIEPIHVCVVEVLRQYV